LRSFLVRVHRRLGSELRVEVGDVHRTRDARLERRLDLLVHESIKVNMILEEWVSLDLLGTLAPQALGGVTCDESRQNGASLIGEVLREGERILSIGFSDDGEVNDKLTDVENLVVHLVSPFIVERRKTGHHLVQQDTESPPIDGPICIAVSNAKT
jgi:hypothetical protein